MTLDFFLIFFLLSGTADAASCEGLEEIGTLERSTTITPLKPTVVRPFVSSGSSTSDLINNFVGAVEDYSELTWPGARKSTAEGAITPTLSNGRITFDQEHFPVTKAVEEWRAGSEGRLTKAAAELLKAQGANFKPYGQHGAIEFTAPNAQEKTPHVLSRLAELLGKPDLPVKVVYDHRKAMGRDSDALSQFDPVERILYVSHGALLANRNLNALTLHELVHVFEKLGLEKGEDSLFHGWVEPFQNSSANRHIPGGTGYGYTHLTEIPALSHTVSRLSQQYKAMLNNGNPTLKEKQTAIRVIRGFTTLAAQTMDKLNSNFRGYLRDLNSHTLSMSIVNESTYPELVKVFRKRGNAFPIKGFEVVYLRGSSFGKDTFLLVRSLPGELSEQTRRRVTNKLSALEKLTGNLSSHMTQLEEDLKAYGARLPFDKDAPYFTEITEMFRTQIREAERSFRRLNEER